MPAATTKSALLSVTAKEFEKLQSALDRVPQALRLQPDANSTTLKDIVGHRAHWVSLFLGWYADRLTGGPVFFLADGYKWNDLKRYNADLRAAQADLSWDDARAMLDTNHEELTRWMRQRTEEELYGGPMKGANNKWPPGRWAEAAGPSHYRSAAKYIRTQLKAAKT